MGYPLLILGVLTWSGAHLFKRLAPAPRAALGDGGARALVSVLLLLAIVLMVLGYRWADPTWLWSPPPFLRHVNNLLSLVAFYLIAASVLKSRITRVIRHPQLTAVKTWSVAHLLVVPTLPGAILFGGLLAWAVVSVILLNRANRTWVRPEPASLGTEIGAVVGGVVLTGVVGWLHGWLGPWPFG